ncbi:lamin tail domain-containing protein, partial [bacterium]
MSSRFILFMSKGLLNLPSSLLLLVFCLSGLFVFGDTVQAAEFGDVVINEIAWMGSIENWRYEWIELYNNSDSNESISLDGWKIELYRDDMDFTIETIGVIKDYFLIVAFDGIFDNYDFNYSNLGGKFSNGGQRIVLKDDSGDIINEISCFSEDGWFAGNNNTKQTMEKTVDGWQTSLGPGGTPRDLNSSGELDLLPEDEEDESGEQEEQENGQNDQIADETAQGSSVSNLNITPIADAGDDIITNVGALIHFNGSAS